MWMRKTALKAQIKGKATLLSAPLRLFRAMNITALALSSLAFSASAFLGAAQAHIALSDYTPNYSAQQDSLLRPCFGALLSPQMRSCHAFNPRGHLYGHGPLRSSALIDCDRESPSLIEAKIAHVRTGGAVRFKGRRCHVSLDLKRSIVLIGTGSGPEATQIVARDGESCVRVDPSADKVFIENMVLISNRGGQAACVYSSNAELTLKNVTVRYEGDSAAVHIYDGRLNLINSNLVARTRYAALSASNVQIFAESSVIASTSDGVIATLDGDSSLQGITVLQLGDWRGFERGQNAHGMDLKLNSTDSILTLDDMHISDFADALTISGGGEALLSRTAIDGASHGISSSLNRIRIINNVIKADEIGIHVSAGTAFVGYNRVALVRTAGLLASDSGEVRAVDNRIDVDPEGCTKLKWGALDPAQRTCTPWYKGSEFDIPADSDQAHFQNYWPNNLAALSPERAPSAPASAPDKVQDPVGKN